MPRHLAFLRAVNLGPRRKVPMAELRERLTAAGFTDVRTHIQTGNVALTSRMRSQSKVEAAVEELLGEWCGFEVPTIVRSPAELAALVAQVDATPPLVGKGGPRYVAFAKDELDADAKAALAAYEQTREGSRVVGRDLLLEIDSQFHTATLTGAKLERLAGTTLTARDLKVVRAIDEKWSST